MKKFLIPLFAGLFVVSLLFAPMVVLADDAIEPATTCTARSKVDVSELESLTGVTGTVVVDAGVSIPYASETAANKHVNENFAIICAYSLIEWGTMIAFLVISALSVLVIVFAAFLFLTAAGNPENTKKAKSFLLYAVIGIVIAIFARLIPNIIINFLG